MYNNHTLIISNVVVVVVLLLLQKRPAHRTRVIILQPLPYALFMISTVLTWTWKLYNHITILE